MFVVLYNVAYLNISEILLPSKIIALFLAYVVKKIVPLHQMQQGQKRLKFAAWLCSKFFLVHEEVLHGVAIKE